MKGSSTNCGFHIFFLEDFGHHFKDSCILRTPDGKETKVTVLKVRSKVFFGEGWGEFCTAYRVWIGHLVVFQYCGNATFDVIMFDMSTTEVDYRTDLHYTDRPSVAVASWMLDVVRQTCSDQSLLGLGPEQRTEGEVAVGQPSGSLNAKVPVQRSPRVSNRGERYHQRIARRGCEHRGNRASLVGDVDPVRSSSKPVSKSKKAGCAAHVFCTAITNACLAKNGQIWVPSAHSAACLKDVKKNAVTLVYEGNMFVVGLHKTTKGFRLGKGWADFAHACAFRVGDVLEFELVDQTEIVYGVNIIE